MAKTASKKTNESKVPLVCADRVILNRVSYHLFGETEKKFSEQQWNEEVETEFKGACAYCGEKKPPFEKEHIIPINKNGLGLRHNGNIIPACKDCNTEKRKYDRNEDGEGYIRFCIECRKKGALTRIRHHMKIKGYKPATEDKTTRKRIKKLIEKANEEMTCTCEKYAKRIARIIRKEMK